MRAKRLWPGIAGLIVLSAVSSLRCPAQAPLPDEFQVRAAIIANLVRFVTWPSARTNPHAPIVVGLLGYDQQSAALEKYLNAHSSDGKPFQIRKLGHSDPSDDCQVVYVSPAERWRFEEISDSLSANGVLTISDDQTFAIAGGIVGLPVVGDRIEIQINLIQAQRGGLVISSRLLGLAKVIRKVPSK